MLQAIIKISMNTEILLFRILMEVITGTSNPMNILDDFDYFISLLS